MRFSLSRRKALMAAVCSATPFMSALATGTAKDPASATAALTPLIYVVAKPRRIIADPPILFLMHGFGADEQDLLPLAASLPPEFVVVSFRAPYANPDSGYRWYDNHKQAGQTDGNAPQLLASETAVLKRIDELTIQFKANPQRVFIGGFSQGAVMSYLIGLSHPDRFRGVIVLSGAILPAVSQLLATSGERKGRSQPPFFVGHGSADPTVPFADADQSAMLLSGWHVPLAFHRYEGMGHATSDQEIMDLNVWLQGLE